MNTCKKCNGALTALHSKNKYVCYDCKAEYPIRSAMSEKERPLIKHQR